MKRLRASAAFTLLEMLVAAAITAVLAGVMLTVVVNTLNAWSRTQGTLTTEAQAQFVLDQLARDLDGVVVRQDGAIWLAASLNNLEGAVAAGRPARVDIAATGVTEYPAQLRGATFGSGGMWLRFTSSSGVLNSSAAPAVVSYEIGRVRLNMSGDVPFRYFLFRAESSPDAPFVGGYDLNPEGTAPVYMAQLRELRLNRVIAENVIDFGIWFYARQADGTLRRLFPGDAQGSAATFPTAESQFPDVADVVVRILTPEGGRLIQACESSASTADWWETAMQHSKVFTRRVALVRRGF